MKKFKIIFVLLILLILIVFFINLFIKNFNKAAEDYAQNNIKNHLTAIINNEFHSKIILNNSLLEGIINIEHDNGNKISAIFVNTINLNLFASAMIIDLTHKIENTQYESFGIPLGNTSGIRLLSGLGPHIKVRIKHLGNITANIRNDFISTGINQSLHRVYLDIRAAVSVLTPFTNEINEIECSFTLAETIIIGEIPNVYFSK